MLMKISPCQLDIFSNEIRVLKYMAVNPLQYISIPIVLHFPSMIDQAIAKAMDNAFLYIYAIGR